MWLSDIFVYSLIILVFRTQTLICQMRLGFWLSSVVGLCVILTFVSYAEGHSNKIGEWSKRI